MIASTQITGRAPLESVSSPGGFSFTLSRAHLAARALFGWSVPAIMRLPESLRRPGSCAATYTQSECRAYDWGVGTRSITSCSCSSSSRMTSPTTLGNPVAWDLCLLNHDGASVASSAGMPRCCCQALPLPSRKYTERIPPMGHSSYRTGSENTRQNLANGCQLRFSFHPKMHKQKLEVNRRFYLRLFKTAGRDLGRPVAYVYHGSGSVRELRIV